MLKLRSPSHVPPGGAFQVTEPTTGHSFSSVNPTVVYFNYRKFCRENNLSVPDIDAIEALMCQQHPEWCVEKNKRITGLGDVVYSIAHPIAVAIDAVAGTNIKGCGGCNQRRDALNKLVPL